MFTKVFWQRAGERALKSFAQSLVAVLTAEGLGLFEAAWPKAISTAGMVALLSGLTSLASSTIGAGDDPSAIAPATKGVDTSPASTLTAPSSPAPASGRGLRPADRGSALPGGSAARDRLTAGRRYLRDPRRATG